MLLAEATFPVSAVWAKASFKFKLFALVGSTGAVKVMIFCLSIFIYMIQYV
jgi:hypothetical protein